MGSATHLDLTGGNKARKPATLKGAIVCAVLNAVLGAVLGVVILAVSAPAEYPPKADATIGPLTLPPSGLYYWAGVPGGDYQNKEDQFLAGSPDGVAISDGELNAWSAALFKSDVGHAQPVVKGAAKTADDSKLLSADQAQAEVKDGIKTAETNLKTWGLAAGTPNFHAFKDPAAPADVPVSFQVALPVTITLFGLHFDTVYQARGVFVASSTGPRFKLYSSFFGHARIPVLPGLAQKVFNTFTAKYAGGDDMKKYADAWGKLSRVSVREGGLLLGGK